MHSTRLIASLLIILLLIGIWWSVYQQNQTHLATLRATGTAHYHAIETQVYLTWTPQRDF